MSHFEGQFRGQKSRGPLKMSREMAHKVILPPQKNYIPQFLKQRDINSYSLPADSPPQERKLPDGEFCTG